ncbi:MAG: DUF2937 family protein [Parvularculaceae bacterium]
MIGRFLAVVLGLAGAALGSQAPGFTLLYLENLQGRIDELRPIVEQFDADVARYGYSRTTALAECETSTGLLEALCTGYAMTIRRYEELAAHMATLKAASELKRPMVLAASYKRDVAESVMKEFKPTVPLAIDGAIYAGGGFGVVWGGLSFIFGLFGAMAGGRR